MLEKSQGTLIIPVSALQSPGIKVKGEGQKQKKNGQAKGKDKRFIVQALKQDGAVENREVSVGVRNAISAEILSGLSEGETVITGAASAQNGNKKGGGLDGGKKGGKL